VIILCIEFHFEDNLLEELEKPGKIPAKIRGKEKGDQPKKLKFGL